ncbi:MAG: EamA family transporter RarD [Sinobacteraceae bacterium]|nr:EamA family transporter RarD [Nevskiaceae bacterium]
MNASAVRGFWSVVAAFLIWGGLPLYLKALQAVPPLQIMAHRLVWCCVFVIAVLAGRGELAPLRLALRNPAHRRRLLASGALISLNWLTYVWAVANDHVVEASLGYFINPLVNVLLGVLLLHERLSCRQWSAIGLATAGVLWLSWQAGAPPWIALVLAFSFGTYGLIRKTVAVEALPGLAAETALIAPLGIAYLLGVQWLGQGAFGHLGLATDALLLAGGPLTAVPLALFAWGARRIRYSTVGLIQYLGPTLQLLLGVLVYGEPFTRGEALGFGLIWSALAIYAFDNLRALARTARPLADPGAARAP